MDPEIWFKKKKSKKQVLGMDCGGVYTKRKWLKKPYLKKIKKPTNKQKIKCKCLKGSELCI